MIGSHYWFTGIVLTPHREGEKLEWGIGAEFFDDGFCDRSSTQGELNLRYIIPDAELSEKLDVLVADMARLGFQQNRKPGPTVYMKGDGEYSDIKYPDDWRERANAEARRLGWQECYK